MRVICPVSCRIVKIVRAPCSFEQMGIRPMKPCSDETAMQRQGLAFTRPFTTRRSAVGARSRVFILRHYVSHCSNWRVIEGGTAPVYNFSCGITALSPWHNARRLEGYPLAPTAAGFDRARAGLALFAFGGLGFSGSSATDRSSPYGWSTSRLKSHQICRFCQYRHTRR